MESWRNVLSMKEYDDYEIVKAPLPVYDPEKFNIAFECCKENLCGCYDTNWGCQPGAKIDVAEFYKQYDYVLVVSRTYEDIDVKDEALVDAIGDDIHRVFTNMLVELRKNNVNCKIFLDGPCKYCGECAYPEPCRYPEMKIASVSTLGIDLNGWFESFGKKLEFLDNKMTLYGLIFIKD